MALPKNFQPKVGESKYTMTGLQSGETVKIRVLSDFIAGRKVWSDDQEGRRKPNRFRDDQNIPVSAIGVDKYGNPERIRQFIAAKVWNYETKQVEVFETDKASIINQIFNYENDSDYGDSQSYDLKISKSGQGMDTEYSVIPAPPKPVEKAILVASRAEQVNLQALFDGKDPFNSTEHSEEESGVMTSDEVANDVPF